MKSKADFSRTLLFLAIILVAIGGLVSSGVFGLNWKFFNQVLTKSGIPFSSPSGSKLEKVKVVTEESVVTEVVEETSDAVVTVGITKTNRVGDIFELDPFDPFAPFRRREGGSTQKVEQDIGSGFIVEADGLIVTNKHVVADSQATYRIITKDDKTYDVQKIYRDPVNDLAILKINASGLPTMELGDSSKIKVGQLAIAIGTALGEFRSTVTTGVISGMGRGITAGGLFTGAERLDNVIQTDAAINPGNSGGPLLNSSGQVIGINVAVSAEGQNIGFALPINVVKEALANFNQTGKFDRPFLGVRYKVLTRDVAVLNDLPEGAYVIEVVAGSPAARAGVLPEDIIVKLDNVRLMGENAELSAVIGKKKVGDTVSVVLYRDGKEISQTITLGNQSDQ